MCGIITLYNFKANIDTAAILDLYEDQKSRGSDGFGFSYLTKTGAVRTRRFVDEAETFFQLSKVRSRLVMFHHRFPTSTRNVAVQNHPINNDRHYKYAYSLVHNGIISNEDKLRVKHYARGVTYATKKGDFSFNDSEALLHELILHVEEGKALECQGSAAWVLLQSNKHDMSLNQVFYGRHFNPLIHWQYGKDIVLSSECPYTDIGKTGLLAVDTLYAMQWGKSLKTTATALTFPIEVYAGTGAYGVHGSRGYGSSIWKPSERMALTSGASVTAKAAAKDNEFPIDDRHSIEEDIVRDASGRILGYYDLDGEYRALSDKPAKGGKEQWEEITEEEMIEDGYTPDGSIFSMLYREAEELLADADLSTLNIVKASDTEKVRIIQDIDDCVSTLTTADTRRARKYVKRLVAAKMKLLESEPEQRPLVMLDTID